MKISIIMPVFNAEQYLDESISSVIHQTDKSNWELLLIDDGSTDNSGSICDRYSADAPEQIRVFHKQNEGQYMSRLFGMERCSGDYVGFLDTDDYLDKNYVENILACAEETGRPDVICFSFLEIIGREKEPCHHMVSDSTILFQNGNELSTVYNQLFSGQLTGSMCSKVFKTQLVKANTTTSGVVTQSRFGEDAFHSFLLLSKANSIVYYPKELYVYMRREGSASKGYETRPLSYYNTKYVTEMLEQQILYSKKCGSEDAKILYARCFNETVYHMLNYYRSALSFSRRMEILRYDWTTYLTTNCLAHLQNNPYVRESYLPIWDAFLNKRYLKIIISESFRGIKRRMR